MSVTVRMPYPGPDLKFLPSRRFLELVGTSAVRGHVVSRTGQHGFSLLEALVCLALLSGTGIAVAGAVASGAHAQAMTVSRERLRSDAVNVLDELRASTAYDPVALQKMSGKTTSSTLDITAPDGTKRAETVSLHVAPHVDGAGFAVAGSGYDATVTVSDVTGASVTEMRRLAYEAPPPGSSVDDKGLPVSGSGNGNATQNHGGSVLR